MQDCPLLILHPDDNIAIAKRGVEQGKTVQPEGGPEITTQDVIDLGHKVASRKIARGDAVRKFGQLIGFATEDIEAGQWVHVHNLSPGELSLDYAFSTDVPEPPKADSDRTFMGYKRPSGRVGTRNYVGIISTVNCSATTSKYAVQRIREDIIADYPNIDGIVALTHKGGCAFAYDGEDHRQLSRTMAGFANHPNIGAYIIIGLGCETAQPAYLVDSHGLVQLEMPGKADRSDTPLMMNIQDVGGVRKTVERAKSVLKELLPEANKAQREPCPVSEIILGTECGGSDGNSGITCNPAVGVASDLLVAHGATSILAEVPEIYGAEHILTRRAVNRDVGEKLIKRIKWWENYAAMFGAEIDNNPSVGNKRGGLTTIYEKSLGAIAKGGSTALRDVYEYAEQVTSRGFVIMDTPGFDAASVTGMVAGGANVVVFTTGRGSCYGCKPVPTIKVSSNTPMFERMTEDMDINAGRILDGASVADVGEEIFEKVVAVASGEETKSESQGIGDEEFCPWVPGPVL
ncbi:MAG: galactonate dehydratase [Planctomycetaceae bacterium]|nr:galactonate dehydratase [Planctomycetaceae bacterium]